MLDAASAFYRFAAETNTEPRNYQSIPFDVILRDI